MFTSSVIPYISKRNGTLTTVVVAKKEGSTESVRKKRFKQKLKNQTKLVFVAQIKKKS